MNLRALQHSMAEVLRGRGDAEPLLTLCTGKSTQARLQIYRNHFLISLTEAMAATYPVTRVYLGADTFDALVQDYVRDQPPVSGCLADYGEGLAQWLDRRQGIPALAVELATLEWSLERVGLVRAPRSFPFEALAQLPSEQYETIVFQLAPGARLLRSDRDLLGFYDRLREAQDFDHPQGCEATPHCWLLFRKPEGVGVLPADASLASVFALCQARHPLSALGEDLHDDHLQALFTLVGKGIIESFAP